MKNHKPKNAFRKGAITTEFIANSIAKHQVKTSIGAHNIFLGQVRTDEINAKKVVAIDYTAHEDMANLKFHEIREAAFLRFDLSCMHIYHSIGNVNAGKICLFVFRSVCGVRCTYRLYKVYVLDVGMYVLGVQGVAVQKKIRLKEKDK